MFKFTRSSRGMFKIPGRKGLDDICKLDLFLATPPAQVAWVWNEHHKQYIQYWGRVISSAAYEALRPRLTASPYFVIPVFRDKGLFNVVTNFHNDLIGVTPIREYQTKQDHAQVHMTIQFFTELASSKHLVLVRCEIQDKVFVRQDCIFLTQMLLKYYTLPRLYEQWVETFNRRPNQFDFHAYLRQMKDEAQKDNINIEDKKYDYRLGDMSLRGGVGGGQAAGPIISGQPSSPVSQDSFGPTIDEPSDVVKKIITSQVEKDRKE